MKFEWAGINLNVAFLCLLSWKKEIDQYIIFSTKELQLNLSKKVTFLTDLDSFKNDLSFNIEIIFDTNSFTFNDIIAFMNRNKSKNLTFKNYISNSSYLIGSNNSIDRGEVIQLKN